MTRVVVLDDYQDVARGYGPWAELGPDVELVVSTRHLDGDDAVTGALAGAQVVVAMRERTAFPAALFTRLPDLRLLVTTGMANVAVDLDAARSAGVTVCGTGGFEPATAELTWALTLGLIRHLPAEHAAVRAGGWQHTVGGDLCGRTLGVAGLGRLGSRVARVGVAFGMRVLAWSRNLDPDAARGLGAEPVGFDLLLAESDIVTLHLRLSERTRGLLGAAELARMRPGALLVNTSRGPIVDEAALLDALHAGRLGGAALDVFDTEPLPADHPLRSAPRTVLTPHLGYVTDATYRVFYRDAVEDIAAFLAGRPVRVLPG